LEYDHGSFKATSETVRQHLLTSGAVSGVQLCGKALKPGDEGDVMQLWKYLYDIGFLNARVADNRQKDGYRHIYPREDPNYVSKARWNDMQATAWEIGPAYRDFLISLQQEKLARTGLPPKRRKKRR
jgi:predicted transcriptional regulator